MLFFRLSILGLVIQKVASDCSSNEFSYKDSGCAECSLHIANCESCSSGSYSSIVNGSFEEPVADEFTHFTYGWEYFDSLPGWTLEPGGNVEINRGFGYAANDGVQYLQTANSDNNHYVYQDLVTETNHLYEIELFYSARPETDSDNNEMKFYWGENTETVRPDGISLSTTNWIKFTSVITANGSSTQIKIEGTGTPNDGLGPFVDNVSYANKPTCITCLAGFYLDTNSCHPCNDVHPMCLNCLSSTQCTSCQDGYYLENETCVQCPSYCTKCLSSDECTECLESFTLESGNCVCADGKYLDTDTCKDCSDNHAQCLACNNLTECTSCSDGYFLETNTCFECPGECSKCLAFSNCTECDSNYTLDTGVCACLENEYLESNTCNSCSDVHAECLTCNSSTECTSCSDEYFLETDTCFECPGECSKCLAFSNCTECNSNFSLDAGVCACLENEYLESNTCNSCSDVHAECLTCNSSAECTSCSDGYFLETDTCFECPGECSKCLDASICTECLSTYSLISGECTCQEGEYKDADSNSCKTCSDALSQCTACNSSIQCTSCSQSYYLQDDACLPCSLSCLDCQSTSHCSICRDSFTQENYSCKCESGYYQYGSMCVECDENCKECEGKGSCLECEETYNLAEGLCECPKYYMVEETSGLCVYDPLTFEFLRGFDFFQIVFSEDLSESLNSSDIEAFFNPSSIPFNFTVLEQSQSLYKLTIEEVPEDLTLISIRIGELEGESGRISEPSEFTVEVYDYYRNQNDAEEDSNSEEEIEDNEEEEIIATDEEIFNEMDADTSSKTSVATGMSASMGISIIFFNLSALWSFMNFSMIIYYIPFQNINMPSVLKKYCQGFGSKLYGLAPDLISYIGLEDPSHSEELFSGYDIESSNFFVNASVILSILIVGTVLFAILFLVYYVSRRYLKRTIKCIEKVIGQFKWNFFLRLLIIGYLDLMFAGLLSLKAVRFI